MQILTCCYTCRLHQKCAFTMCVIIALGYDCIAYMPLSHDVSIACTTTKLYALTAVVSGIACMPGSVWACLSPHNLDLTNIHCRYHAYHFVPLHSTKSITMHAWYIKDNYACPLYKQLILHCYTPFSTMLFSMCISSSCHDEVYISTITQL